MKSDEVITTEAVKGDSGWQAAGGIKQNSKNFYFLGQIAHQGEFLPQSSIAAWNLDRDPVKSLTRFFFFRGDTSLDQNLWVGKNFPRGIPVRPNYKHEIASTQSLMSDEYMLTDAWWNGHGPFHFEACAGDDGTNARLACTLLVDTMKEPVLKVRCSTCSNNTSLPFTKPLNTPPHT